MLILGLDQSLSRTGWALYDVPGDPSAIECGSFSSDVAGATAEAKCDAFAEGLKALIGPRKRDIDFIVWERAKPHISAYGKKHGGFLKGEENPFWTVNSAQLVLPEIQGVVRAAAVFYRIPHESVAPATWRGALWPGKGNIDRKAAKAKARDYCRMLGVRFANEDQAEAACVALWAATSSMKFRMLRFQAKEAAA